jgi:rod shape-determining protein MreD
MVLIAWRQLRPGLMPVWAGLPLGLFDDLYSGQPLGSAILLWSMAMIALEIIELRIPWRNFLVDWAVGAALIAVYIFLAMGLSGSPASPHVLVPQLAISLAFYPLVSRLVAVGDRIRLTPFRAIG